MLSGQKTRAIKGGNQRDLAREKAAKKGKGGTKASDTDANKGLTLEQRKKRDGDALKEKQARKAAGDQAASSSK